MKLKHDSILSFACHFDIYIFYLDSDLAFSVMYFYCIRSGLTLNEALKHLPSWDFLQKMYPKKYRSTTIMSQRM